MERVYGREDRPTVISKCRRQSVYAQQRTVKCTHVHVGAVHYKDDRWLRLLLVQKCSHHKTARFADTILRPLLYRYLVQLHGKYRFICSPVVGLCLCKTTIRHP